MSRATLLLIDGSSYLYRAFHALPELQTSRGEPTGAIHGVAAMLRRLLHDYDPDYCAVVFDAKGPTFRNDLYASYKAHRPPMPEALAAQIAPLHELVQALGLPLLVESGVEADDVIGTLATRAVRDGLGVIISSSDKDLAQLVNPHVRLVNTLDDRALDEAGVVAKFGVPPDRIVDYLALVGDAVDNVPGVAKIGPKTAVKWLQEYGNLDALIAHAGDVPGKIGENLRASLEFLPLSRRLLTIACDVPLPCEPRALTRSAPQHDKLREIYQRLEFKTWLRELLAQDPSPGEAEPAATGDLAAARGGYALILTEAAFEDWLARLAAAPLFAFDTETTSLDYMQARIVGVSFALTPGEAAYLPFGHDYLGAPAQLDAALVLGRLKPLLEDPQRGKLGHNLKYDRSVLLNHGIELRGIAHDTMLQSYVLDSAATRHDLDSLALKYLGHKTIHFADLAGKGAQQITFNQVPIERAGPYAAEDADVSLRLHHVFWPRIQQLPGVRQLYEEIELPLVAILSAIERHGVMIDPEMLRRQSRELETRLAEIEREAYELAGQPFNLGSPKQIQAILFDKLGLPITERTATGQASTAESVLAELALDYPLPQRILDYRALSKLKSTYTDKLPAQVAPSTGRVHTSYHQAVAATGRLSSSDPNLQNIPIRTAEGRRIRQAFIAPPGRVLLSADYSQIELRIMAHMSGDAGLTQAFAAGLDIHRATAAEVFGVALDAVSDAQRRAAKAINFGLIYGMSAFGLARQLDLDRTRAQAYIDQYFARYPGVKRFMDEIRATARAQGYVETLYHRRLYLPDIRASNNQRRQNAERVAINAPIQGTEADIVKIAMIAIDRWLRESGIDASLIMQVHDELVLEVAEPALATTIEHIRALMMNAATLSVPLVVDTGFGKNWDEAH
ncbi:MAG: DNA polymerase I [Gammaproteobacteria bacterium]|nr:DNA polymerase I [Gammaproteobacteria bacterium]